MQRQWRRDLWREQRDGYLLQHAAGGDGVADADADVVGRRRRWGRVRVEILFEEGARPEGGREEASALCELCEGRFVSGNCLCGVGGARVGAMDG